MSFYENTLVIRQDLPKNEIEKIKSNHNEIINNNSGKVIKVEEWGLLNCLRKIKNFNKGFFIHYKFEANNQTLEAIKSKIKVDNKIIRNLIVKYKKLDTAVEYFGKDKQKKLNEKKK